MWKQIMKYFGKHVTYNSVIHAIGGMGVGIILARPMAGDHPIRWGVTLIVISILGHVYPLGLKK